MATLHGIEVEPAVAAEPPAVASAPPVYGRGHRRLLVLLSIVAIAFHGGVVYGWPSMRVMLRRDDVLRPPRCPSYSGSLSANATLGVCTEQELAFGYIYTTGAWSNQAGRLVIGIALDRFGPRVTAVSSALAFGAGAAIFAMSMFASSAAGLVAGFFFVGAGGAGIQLSVQSVAALFPQNRSLIMAMLSGAFQFASGVYVVFEVVHRQQQIALRTMILLECLVAGGISVLLWAALPDLPFGIAQVRTSRGLWATCKAAACRRPLQPSPQPSSQPSSQSSPQFVLTMAPTDEGIDCDPSAKPKARSLRSLTFREQALSPECLLILTFFAIGALQCQFTVATAGLQFERKGDLDGAATRHFGLCMVLVVLWTPILGILTDRNGFGFTLTFVNSVLLISTACLLVPSLELTYFGSLAYSIGRVSLWASYFTYNAHVFGFQHFGKIVGCGMTLAACFSLLQYPLLQLTVLALDGDFFVANILLGALHCTAFATVPRLMKGAREATRALSSDGSA